MLLSIIVTHYKTPSILKLCLKAINNFDIKKEIILVDSETESKTQELIDDEFPEVIPIFFKKNVGYAKLVNAGIKKSLGDFLLILNADVIPSKESTKSLMEFLRENSDVGIVAPQLLNFDGTPQFSAFRFYTPWTVICRRTWIGKTPWCKKELDKFLLKDKLITNPAPVKSHYGAGSVPLTTKGIEVDWLMGSCLMVKREALKKVGLLDERFFMYFEDVDWCRRFWENGYKVIYLPSVSMYHYHYKASDTGRGISDLFFNKHTRIHLMSALKYFWKYRKIKNEKAT